jgi:hypothetical protein
MAKAKQKETGKVMPHSTPAPTVAPSGHSGAEWVACHDTLVCMGAKQIQKWCVREGSDRGPLIAVMLTKDVAHMLAGAPQLLELVVLFEQVIVHEMKRCEAKGDDEGARLKILSLNMARAAIAKAKGLAS